MTGTPPDLWAAAARQAASAMLVLGPEGRVAAVNSAFCDLAGQLEAELLGKPLVQLTTNAGVDLFWALAEGRAPDAGEALLGRPGEPPVVVHYTAGQFLHAGQANLVLTLTDVTGQHRLLDTLHEGVCVQDSRGRVVALNRHGEELLGLTAEQMRHRNSRDFEEMTIQLDGSPYPAQDQPAVLALRTGQPVEGVVLGLRRPDGSVRWVRANSRAYAANDGHTALDAARVVSTFVDITDLVESQRRFRAIFDHTFEFIGLLDANGILLEANKTALDFIGIEAADVVGLHFADTPWWQGSPERDLLRESIAEAARGHFVRFETTHPSVDGRTLTVDFSLRPVLGPDGRVVMLIPEGRDITEAKRAENALRDAKAEAETASRAKSSFLATMSHELRTPLNAVIGYTELILTEVFGPLGNARYRDYLDLVHTSGMHLLEVINDILDISKIETGKIDLRESCFDMVGLAERVLRLVEHRAAENELTLDVGLPEGALWLFADQQRCSQILLNLLSNAIKFTPPGGRVALHVRALPQGCELVVEDSGIGIRPEDHALIWRPFEQVDSTLSRRYEGTGLGLPITRHLVEAHQGKISLDSKVGQGTTVRVLLPAERVRDSGFEGQDSLMVG